MASTPSQDLLSPTEFRAKLETAIANEDWERAGGLVDAELTQRPNQPELFLLAAQLASRRQQWEHADRHFRKLMEASSDLPDPILLEWMQAKCAAGNIMQAIDFLRELENKSVTLHRLQSRLLTSVGDLEGANDQHQKLLERGNIRPNELYALAGLLGRAHRDPAFIEAAAQRYPDDLRPRLAAAVDDWLNLQPTDAIAELERIVEHHPDYEPALGLLAFLLADTAQFTRLEALVAEHGIGTVQHPWYWYGAGCALREAGQTKPAVRCLAESIRRGGDVRLATSQLAAALGETDQPELAQAVAQHASRLQELRLACRNFVNKEAKSQHVALTVGEALLKLGRVEEAKHWAELAEMLEQDSVQDASTRIARLTSAKSSPSPNPKEWLDTLERRFDLPSRQALLSGGPVPTASERPRLAEERAGRVAEHQNLQSSIRFRDEAVRRGLTFFYDHGEPEGKLGKWLHQNMGGGVAVADFDHNGWEDLFFTQAGGHPLDSEPVSGKHGQSDRLFLNHAGHFHDSPAALAAFRDGGYGQGVAAGDVNEDGFTDLYVAHVGENRLWINNGDGTFRDATGSSGINGSRWTSSVAIADLNNDGYSDLVEANYCQMEQALKFPCHDDQGRLDSCLPGVYEGERDRAWISRGDGTFVEQTDWGSASQFGRGLGVLVADLDQRPGVEVFVANDNSSNHFWQLEDSGDWKEWALVRGLAFGADGRPQGCMGIAYGDPDHDGDFDLVVTNYAQEYNSWYVQRSAGIFADRARHSGLAASLPMVGFGTVMEDFNCDGAADLFVSNGLTNRNPDEQAAPFAQPAQLFRWTGKRWSEQIHASSKEAPLSEPSYLSQLHVGRAVARGDFNHDGYPDLVIVHLGEAVSLLMGQYDQPADFVGLRLVATRGSRDAVGARITITTNQRTRSLQRTAGHGYYCSHSPIVRTGLAPGESVESVEIRWPSGHVQELKSLSPGRIWTLIEEGTRLDSLSGVPREFDIQQLSREAERYVK